MVLSGSAKCRDWSPAAKSLLTHRPKRPYLGDVEKPQAKSPLLPPGLSLLEIPLPRSYLNYVGQKLFALGQIIRGLGAFSLITL